MEDECEECVLGLYPLGFSIVEPAGLLIDWRDSLGGLSIAYCLDTNFKQEMP